MAEVAKAIMEDVVILNDDLFYGKGTHKKCYRHPKDKSKCIKMAYSAYGQKDLDRELKYLKILSTQGGRLQCSSKILWYSCYQFGTRARI